jgi:hypothetical protein
VHQAAARTSARTSAGTAAGTRNGPTRRRIVIGLLLVAVVVGMLVSRWSPSAGSLDVADTGGVSPDIVPPADRGPTPTTPRDGAVGEDDGTLPAGVTVFAQRYAGIARLEPRLRRALRLAASDAAADGVELDVNSGWRSRAYQDRLLREAVAQYGSEAAAARWVATADTSPHVAGEAVDIGPASAAAWLADHGAAYGLCRIYRNEPWHFELRPGAVDGHCPGMYADPTHDPRMR